MLNVMFPIRPGWHRAQLKDVTGIDMTRPGDASPPELLLDWRA